MSRDLSGQDVREWLVAQDDDRHSVVTSDFEPTRSEFGDFDVSRHVVDEEALFGAKQTDVGVAALVEDALGDVARGAQRLAVCGMHRLYAKGRMHDHPVYGHVSTVRQRHISLEGFMSLGSLDDTALFDALRAGPLVTRLGAATGLGKTRKLSGSIASKCGLRVLQVEPDRILCEEAATAQAAEYGDVVVSPRAWSRRKRAFLTVITYHEFFGYVCSGGRDRLFEDFDVFVFDEGVLPEWQTYFAENAFASYSKPHNSLLILSATASTESSNNSTARRVGRFEEAAEPVSLEKSIEDGTLLRNLRDRTMLIVPSDEHVAMARAYLDNEGYDVRVLDTGSLRGDKRKVDGFLRAPSALVPRVVVAHSVFGVGHNLPLSRVVTTASQCVYELTEDNALVQKEIPVMEKIVLQHKGRTGRGLVDGSGGWIMRTDYSSSRRLMISELLPAYVSLVAAGIEPKPGTFDVVTKLLPLGINRDVARLLMRISLPVGLSVRYLGSDGRIASRFAAAISLFSQSGEPILKSRDPYPVGYDTWVEERVGGYYQGDESDVDCTLRVPFSSPSGLRVVMHTLSAVESELVDVPRWVLPVEEDESDDEVTGVRRKVVPWKAKPREIHDEVPEVVESESSVGSAWAYNADPSTFKVRRKRQAMSWEANGDGSAAVRVLLGAVRDGTLGAFKANPQLDAPEFDGRVAYGLPLGGEISVDSPGGGRVLLVRRSVHDKWMDGLECKDVEFVEVLSALRTANATKRFAASTVFDNWSPVWLSWFRSYSAEGNMVAVKRSGLQKVAIELLGYLYDRFKAEVLTVVNSSNLYKDSLASWFRGTPSLTKFARAVKKGKVPIAQSDKFVERVLDIKFAHDDAVMSLEKVGLFAPHQVTKAQRRLPLRDRHRHMEVIDEAVSSVPGKVGYVTQEERWAP